MYDLNLVFHSMLMMFARGIPVLVVTVFLAAHRIKAQLDTMGCFAYSCLAGVITWILMVPTFLLAGRSFIDNVYTTNAIMHILLSIGLSIAGWYFWRLNKIQVVKLFLWALIGGAIGVLLIGLLAYALVPERGFPMPYDGFQYRE